MTRKHQDGRRAALRAQFRVNLKAKFDEKGIKSAYQANELWMQAHLDGQAPPEVLANTIWVWLNKDKAPHYRTLCRLAAWLECRPDDLIDVKAYYNRPKSER